MRVAVSSKTEEEYKTKENREMCDINKEYNYSEKNSYLVHISSFSVNPLSFSRTTEH
jgi:hypothetical protein